MSKTTPLRAFIFHTDLGSVVTQISQIERYDVEDVIHGRAISQARAVQFLNASKKASPNDPKGERSMTSAFTQSDEELVK